MALSSAAPNTKGVRGARSPDGRAPPAPWKPTPKTALSAAISTPRNQPHGSARISAETVAPVACLCLPAKTPALALDVGAHPARAQPRRRQREDERIGVFDSLEQRRHELFFRSTDYETARRVAELCFRSATSPSIMSSRKPRVEVTISTTFNCSAAPATPRRAPTRRSSSFPD